MAGKLYIVPTPVGNLEDMTFRAVEVLRQVDLILAEDTRTTSVLLKHYGISRPTEAHHKFNEHARVRPVCEKILSGMDIALVSDAGTPGISDPGFMLARACADEGIEVITLPGATAFVPALVDSGLPIDRFAFEGFLPVKKGRQTRLTQLASEGRTMVFYESPYRLAKTLTQMCEYFGAERKASVSREISKVHEETRRGTLPELASWYTDNPPKGEIVLIVEGKGRAGLPDISGAGGILRQISDRRPQGNAGGAAAGRDSRLSGQYPRPGRSFRPGWFVRPGTSVPFRQSAFLRRNWPAQLLQYRTRRIILPPDGPHVIR